MQLSFFLIQSYLEIQKRKKTHKFRTYSFKKLFINSLYKQVEDNTQQKSLIDCNLKVLLNSTDHLEIKNDSSISIEKKSRFPKRSTIRKRKLQYSAFTSNYYSICKYFSWEDSTNSAHFIYYMTSFPSKDDILIFIYKNKNFLTNKHVFPELNVGAQTLNILLQELSQSSKSINLWALERQLRIYLFEVSAKLSSSEILQKIKLLRRLKLIWYFRRTISKPEWMILSVLPVLPPDLRPIIQLEGNQIAISDLNKLYQKVLFRNKRIQKLKIGQYSNTSEEVQYAQRLLQESVDYLIENGKSSTLPNSVLKDRPLKSLADILKGKKGRFRQNLLGKRVDYSGRSVIVVGPSLRLHECGIPREMAIELFQPFLIRYLIFQKKARTILGAKRLIQKNHPVIQDLLEELAANYPVLLNRAPTLHRLSIQSFQPKIVEGKAIILHPLVCAAFNADFDGDQMAVHIPLSYQARAEAWKLLWAQNNLLSPATGQPIVTPTQDMVLGWYYLTAIDLKNFYTSLLKKTNYSINLTTIQQIFKLQKITHFYQFKKFKKSTHALCAYEQNIINIHTPIWFAWKGLLEIEKRKQPILEIRVFANGSLILFSYQFMYRFNWYGSKIEQLICTTLGRILLNITMLTNKKIN